MVLCLVNDSVVWRRPQGAVVTCFTNVPAMDSTAGPDTSLRNVGQ